MYPHERSLVERFADQPFAIVGVNSDRDKQTALKACADELLTWRSFWNGPKGTATSGGIAEQWNVDAWPTTYLIDANGVIRYKSLRGAPLERAIEALLEERPR